MSGSLEALCIVGPTGSGKSSLANIVAREIGTEVVSVDAMQVYRGMDIGTAKQRPSERLVPLRMVDVASVGESYSVALFQRDARSCVDEILSRGTPAVLCGGTGLYLDAVIDEMAFPYGDRDGEERKTYGEMAERLGAARLHALLAERDPRSAALIDPHNVRRVVRALEMHDRGIAYAETHAGLKAHIPHYQSVIWAISMDRACLYERIERRVDLMLAQGLVEEVEALVAEGLTRDGTAGQAIGYKEVMAYLAGECTLEEAVERIKVRTRHYAKRQLSWLRRDGRCRWLDYGHICEDDAVRIILDDLRGEG